MSSSGLTGNISDSFDLLDASEYLDLSDNILTGEVPDFLKNLTSLKVLNLTGNNFTGSIPSSLLKRSEEGSLILRFTNHTIPGNTESKKKMNTLVIVVSCCAVLGLLLILMLAGWFFWLRKGGKVLVASNVTRHIEATIAQKTEHGPHLQIDGGKFTFNHLQVITNNFAQVIRKGAFASFYLGHLDGLKLQSKCIHDLLHSRPENLNLRNETFLALVYEYMPHGSLKIISKLTIDFAEHSVTTDLAMQCTADTSADRPMIVDVVNGLKECIGLEAASEESTYWNIKSESSVQFSALEVEGEKDKVFKSDENLPTEDHAEQEYAPLTEESKDTEGTTNETEEKEKDKGSDKDIGKGKDNADRNEKSRKEIDLRVISQNNDVAAVVHDTSMMSRLRVHMFLRGLDSEYDQVRGEILRKEPKFSLEQSYAYIRKVQSEKQAMRRSISTESSVLAVKRREVALPVISGPPSRRPIDKSNTYANKKCNPQKNISKAAIAIVGNEHLDSASANVAQSLFGYAAFVHIPKSQRSKLDSCAKKCIFVGYVEFQKGYRCYDSLTDKMHISLNVSFHEFEPYYSRGVSQSSLQGEGGSEGNPCLIANIDIFEELEYLEGQFEVPAIAEIVPVSAKNDLSREINTSNWFLTINSLMRQKQMIMMYLKLMAFPLLHQ
ncbi:hypothetical protein ZIOFF_009412 [Zingiber officinale]|uniref:Retroviral polymerase SH3-like domain-containing protein n=1 Tax=Zingiber officinale TaxID=94328 RepID=A0A8J5LRG1_ZINOF|nr:hypothetical protein ZIOFF_009412 [Zingiber officinale]